MTFNLSGAIANVSVRLAAGVNGYVEVAGTRAEYLAGAITAVDSVEVAWRRASARDHADAGTLRVSLLSRDLSHSIEWGTEVTIVADVAGAEDVVIGHGWASNITRRRVGGGLGGWRWDIDLVDAIGRAAGYVVRAEPWPTEMASTRLTRMENLGLVTITRAGSNILHDARLAPRDSNSQTMLDIVKLSMPVGYVVGEDGQGLNIGVNLPLRDDTDGGGPTYAARPAHGAIVVPADAVEDLGVDINRAATINEGDVKFRHYSNEENAWVDNNVYRRTSDPRDGSRLSIETDFVHGESSSSLDKVSRTELYLEAIIAATAEARPCLVGSRIAAGPWLAEVLPSDKRNPAPLVRLEGLPTFQGIDVVHHVIAGNLTYSAEGATLVLELEPAALEGWHRATWGTLGPYKRTFGDGWLDGVRYLISDFHTYRNLYLSFT